MRKASRGNLPCRFLGQTALIFRRQNLAGDGRGSLHDETPDFALQFRQHTRVILRRSAIFDKIQRVFATYDVLLCPTVAVPPFEVGIEGPTQIAGRALDRRTWIAMTPLFVLGWRSIGRSLLVGVLANPEVLEIERACRRELNP